MLGMREWLPLAGFAGGMPGANTDFAIRRADGRRDIVSGHASGVIVDADEAFEFRLGSGGGFGDPVDRDAAEVARDVRQGRITVQEAASVYGVVIDAAGKVDSSATPVRRTELLRDRLRRARLADKPLQQDEHAAASERGSGLPLYPGVEQRGPTAYSIASGAVLAVSPDHWTDGCPMLEEQRERLLIRSYLDPLTGRFLLVEALPAGEPRAVDTRPTRWARAARVTSAPA